MAQWPHAWDGRVKELQDSIHEEWARYRRGLEEAAVQQSHRHEEILRRFLEGLAAAGRSPDAPPEASTGDGCEGPRQRQPRGRGARDTDGRKRGGNCQKGVVQESECRGELTGLPATASKCLVQHLCLDAPPKTSVDPNERDTAAIVSVALAPLERAVDRIEALLHEAADKHAVSPSMPPSLNGASEHNSWWPFGDKAMRRSRSADEVGEDDRQVASLGNGACRLASSTAAASATAAEAAVASMVVGSAAAGSVSAACGAYASTEAITMEVTQAVNTAVVPLKEAMEQLQGMLEQESSMVLVAEDIPGGRESRVSIEADRLEQLFKTEDCETPQECHARIQRGLSVFEGGDPCLLGADPESSIPLSVDAAHGSMILRRMYKVFPKLTMWLLLLEEPKREGRLATFVDGKFFESLCAMVISGNAAFTVYTTNWEIAHLGDDLDSDIKLVENLLLSFYTLELVLKLFVHRGYFFVNKEMRWNLFDFVLVTFSLMELLLSNVSGSGGSGADPALMRLLRLLKMARLLRGLRAVRFFSQLRLILNSVLGSFLSLFWSIVMLTIIFYIFGLVFVQGTQSFLLLSRDTVSGATQDDLLANFGSVQAAMLSLYKASTGGEDWSIFYNMMVITGGMNTFLFIFYIAFITIALWNILTGIFVENAMKLAKPDRDELVRDHFRQERADVEELKNLCKHVLDFDMSGTITKDEFVKSCTHDKLRAYLSIQGLEIRDPNLFFGMLAYVQGTDTIGIEEFVNGCMKMKGYATNVDVQSLHYQTRAIHLNQKQMHQDMLHMFSKLGRGAGARVKQSEKQSL